MVYKMSLVEQCDNQQDSFNRRYSLWVAKEYNTLGKTDTSTELQPLSRNSFPYVSSGDNSENIFFII